MYSKKFDPSHYEPIEDLLIRIQALPAGKSLWVNDLSRRELHQTRWLLYNWFYHQGLKRAFRLRVLEGDLRISRLDEEEEEKMTPSLVEFFKRRMLSLSNENEVVKLLQSKKEALSVAQRVLLFEEWKRVMG